MLELTTYADPLRIEGVFRKPRVFAAQRKGATFHTPLTTGTCHIRPGVEDVVEDLCREIDEEQYRLITQKFQDLVESPKFILWLACLRLPTSYRYVHASLQNKKCKDVFRRQLSDQLVFCRGCKARPIRHMVTKNQAAMKEHLDKHEHETDDHKKLYQFLKSTLH